MEQATENRAAVSIPTHAPTSTQLARTILAAFLFTFIAARIVVFLIMSRRVPDLFLHIGGTHIHHLNYGIFLLSAVGAYLLMARPTGRRLSIAALAYGVGLALTFDEFGMWIHLGGGYWQRASFDAVVVIVALLALFAYAPAITQLRLQHWLVIALLLLGGIFFALLLADSVKYASRRIGPALQNLERIGPP
jgi:hypothetical protein